MPLQDRRAGRGRGALGSSELGPSHCHHQRAQVAAAGAGQGGAGAIPRRHLASSRGSAACPKPRLISAGPSGKLGGLGERRGGVADATSATRGTSSAPPFPLPFCPPSCHRKCLPGFPQSELKELGGHLSLFHYL